MGDMQLDQGFIDLFYDTEYGGSRKVLDDGKVAEFVKQERGWVYYNKLLYYKDGRQLPTTTAKRDIYDFLKEIGVKSNIANRSKNVLEAVQLETYVESVPCPENLIGYEDGAIYIDLKTGDITPATDDVFAVNRIHAHYDETKKLKEDSRFFDWLHNLFHDEDIPGFQEFMGYLLIPSTRLQKALLLLGRGREGKSRIGLILNALFGLSCFPAQIDYFESNRFSMPLAQNKLVLYTDDLKKDKLKSTEGFKSMVSSEVPMQAEDKNEKAYCFRPYARWVMCSNAALSALYDTGYAFYRRLYVIRVKNCPPNRKDDGFYFDPVIKNELDGVFMWMLEGLQRLIRNGWILSISEESKGLLQDQQETEDSALGFIRNEIMFGKNLSITNSQLYKAYLSYCVRNREVARKKEHLFELFNEQLDILHIKPDRHLGENRTLNGYKGMALKSTGSLMKLLSDGTEEGDKK